MPLMKWRIMGKQCSLQKGVNHQSDQQTKLGRSGDLIMSMRMSVFNARGKIFQQLLKEKTKEDV